MKRSIKTTLKLNLLLAYLFFTPVAIAQDIIVALSPYQQQAEAHAKQVLKHLTTLEAGSKAVLIDGYRLRKIGDFKIPERKASPKALLKLNAKTVAALMRFAKANTQQDTPTVSNALRLPQLLRHIAENYSRDGMNELDVVVLGSPFYDDPSEPIFSMAEAHIPSDGHIRSSRAVSPYGTADTTDLLKGMRVHMGFGEDAQIQSDQHLFFLSRFWTLLIEQQGGKLVSFIADKETLFDRVLNKASPPKHNFKLEPSTKLEMIRLRRDKPSNPIYERKISNESLSLRNIQKAQDVEIGIRWDCSACDLDLYARGQPNADILYFGRNQTPLGNHWKDFTIAPSLSNGYETISFHVPLNLQQLRMAVNFYEGTAPNGIKGTLRISVDGQTYEQDFTMSATSGNKSAGMDEAFQAGKSMNKYILMFDPLKIIKQAEE